MTATADVAGEKVGEARRRLAAALHRAREVAGTVRDQAVAGAKATDAAVREHPYKAIASGSEWERFSVFFSRAGVPQEATDSFGHRLAVG